MIVVAVVTLTWLVWLQKAHRRRAWLEGPHYVQQIQILKGRPLALPPIKPLKAERG